MIKRPLKAPSAPLTEAQIATLQWPYYASYKKDGIRCLIHPTLGPVSQKMLPIPNHFIRETLADLCSNNFPCLDGELLVPGMTFNENQSVIMSRMHPRQKEFRFLVFDSFKNPENRYHHRLSFAHMKVESIASPHVEWLSHEKIWQLADLLRYEELAIEAGEEGVMLNAPEGYYKEGRSTYREGLLLKVVRHVRDEATVIGFEEGLENCNAATVDGNGLTKRSKHQANMRPNGRLGAFICKWRGHELRIGSGECLTHSLREHIWNHKSRYLNCILTFKFKPFGMKDVPRQPIFCGFRND